MKSGIYSKDNLGVNRASDKTPLYFLNVMPFFEPRIEVEIINTYEEDLQVPINE